MTVYGLAIAPKALKDIESIRKQIARFSIARADKMVARIRSKLVLIQEAPNRNVVLLQVFYKDSRDPVRSTPLDPYMIFFRVVEADRTVRILRVRHGARRPLRRFD